MEKSTSFMIEIDKVAEIMRKISRDKKEVKNGVRVNNTYSNLLRQFNLKGTTAKREEAPPRLSRFMAKPSSILYICLFFGLSIGIGTAFADREIFPSDKPLDQPIQQKVKTNYVPQDKEGKAEVPLPEQRQEGVSGEPVGLEKGKNESVSESFSQHPGVTEDRTEKMGGSIQQDAQATETKDLKKTKNMSSGEKNIPLLSKPSHAFKTEAGGMLPATAGNNLANVFWGLLLLSCGVVLLKTKRVNSY